MPSGLTRTPSGYGRRYESLIPDGTTLVRMGLEDYGVKSWASTYGRLLPADISILGNGTEVLRELTRLCQQGMERAVQRKVAARWAKARQIHAAIYGWVQEDLKERWWGQKPISTARLAAEIWEVIRRVDWVLAHGSLSSWERRLWQAEDQSRWIAGGGGPAPLWEWLWG